MRAMRFAFIVAAAAGLGATAAEVSELDDECPVGSADCALSMRQLRATAGAGGDVQPHEQKVLGPLQDFTAYPMLNCYAGHGGYALDPAAFVKAPSVEECASLCNAAASCAAFVYMRSQAKCWFRIHVVISECEMGTAGLENSQFDTYVKKGQAPSPSELDHYKSYPMTNCYSGHGGLSVDPTFFTTTTSPGGCAKICDGESKCAAFVYMSSQSKCWFWIAVVLSQCEVGTPGTESAYFTTYVKQ